MRVKNMLVLAILACGACEGAPEQSSSTAPDRTAQAAAEGEPISEVQSKLDFGCWFATGAPNFWALVAYIGNDKMNVPVGPGSPVGAACAAYVSSSAGVATLAVGSPYTATCACKYVCGSGGNDDDNGKCGNRTGTTGGNLQCAGQHAIICPGVALQSCGNSCITSICASDPYCCNTQWDDICVGEVTSICGINWDVRSC